MKAGSPLNTCQAWVPPVGLVDQIDPLVEDVLDATQSVVDGQDTA